MIDWTKPIQTRDGRAARVVASGLKGTEYPVVVVITHENGNESSDCYMQSGSCYVGTHEEADDDIVNVDDTERSARLDNNAVDALANDMKYRLKAKREQGFGDWNDPVKVSDADLAGELVARLERGAWIGAANFLMFLYHREAGSDVMLKAMHDAHAARYPLI